MVGFILKYRRELAIAASALAIVGLSLGFWWFLSNQVEARRKAESRAEIAEAQVRGLEDAALGNAGTIARLTARLDEEAALAEKRLVTEQERALAAERRLRQAQGLVDDLRNRLDDSPACHCGIGSDLADRLRDARAEREAAVGPRQ